METQKDFSPERENTIFGERELTITVIRTIDNDYLSTYTLPPDYSGPDKIFSMTAKISPKEQSVFEKKVIDEARKRGISYVMNLE